MKGYMCKIMKFMQKNGNDHILDRMHNADKSKMHCMIIRMRSHACRLMGVLCLIFAIVLLTGLFENKVMAAGDLDEILLYDITVEAGGLEWLVQSTHGRTVGEKVSLHFDKDNIQIMSKPQSEDEAIAQEV